MKQRVCKILTVALLSSLLFSSCKKDNGFEKTELGFSFKHCTVNRNTPKANGGDIIYGQMKILLNNKQLIHTNYGEPARLFVIEKQPRVGSIDEFLTTLHLGDSAIMVAPADSVTKFLDNVITKPTDKIYFYLTVSQIISMAEVSGQEAERQMMQQKEEELLTNFVLEKYDKAEKKPSGLFYINITEGSGAKAEYGKRVLVNYTLTDTTGKILDSNVEEVARKGGIYKETVRYAPFDFVLGDDGLIAGWSEGISYMRAGGHAKLVVPSRLGYGELGFHVIEPYTSLIFDIYLLKVLDDE
ncbi:MAG: FKBP-type peptidyl-prolyl cis-trans isomerase [Bacteroidales bacterium]|nr:FKBP-type peptidyl-prolyl cis-trans isomerase [Bacteroidales bacterium]